MKWLPSMIMAMAMVLAALLLALLLTPAGQQWLSAVLGEPVVSSAADAGEPEEEEEHPSRLQIRDGILGLSLSAETQSLSGLQVTAAKVMNYREEIQALAEVIDIKPLLDLRSRYMVLQAELRISEVQARRAREAYQRLHLLHEDSANISTSQLEQARAELQSAQARQALQQRQLTGLENEAVQAWGATLASWVLDSADINGYFQQLLSRHEVLLNVSLGRNESMPSDTRIIYINRDDNRLNARKAYYVSAAVRTEPDMQGETYYFRTRAGELRVGMQVHVWIPVSGQLIEGVYVPADAVVWQAGLPWVYLYDGENFFYRRSLDNLQRMNEGWFVPASEIDVGQLIVTRGAQMLLSEEYRWQIPDEDDD